MLAGHLPSLLVGTLGLVLLGGTLWARRGRSKAARFWMPLNLRGDWMLERCVVLGAPTFGLLMLSIAAMAALDSATATAIGGFLIIVLLALPGVYFILAFLPLPPWLYPRWAREVLTWRKQADAGLDAWLAERRSQQ